MRFIRFANEACDLGRAAPGTVFDLSTIFSAGRRFRAANQLGT